MGCSRTYNCGKGRHPQMYYCDGRDLGVISPITVQWDQMKFGVVIAAYSGYLFLDFSTCSSFSFGIVSVAL